MPSLIEALIVLAVIIIFSVIILKKKSLDKEGALIAAVLGWAVFWLGGINYFAVLLLFFVIGDLSTRFHKKEKPTHERRTTGNIVGNGGAAFIALALSSPIGFFCAISAALADTLSSEIGILSKEKTRLLVNPRKVVPPGTDGGITLLGLEAAALGAVIIGIVYYFFMGNLIGTGIVVLAGFAGSLVDSFFGAVFERRNMLNNTEVNFLGSGFGAMIGHVLFTFLL